MYELYLLYLPSTPGPGEGKVPPSLSHKQTDNSHTRTSSEIAFCLRNASSQPDCVLQISELGQAYCSLSFL